MKSARLHAWVESSSGGVRSSLQLFFFLSPLFSLVMSQGSSTSFHVIRHGCHSSSLSLVHSADSLTTTSSVATWAHIKVGVCRSKLDLFLSLCSVHFLHGGSISSSESTSYIFHSGETYISVFSLYQSSFYLLLEFIRVASLMVWTDSREECSVSSMPHTPSSLLHKDRLTSQRTPQLLSADCSHSFGSTSRPPASLILKQGQWR